MLVPRKTTSLKCLFAIWTAPLFRPVSGISGDLVSEPETAAITHEDLCFSEAISIPLSLPGLCFPTFTHFNPPRKHPTPFPPPPRPPMNIPGSIPPHAGRGEPNDISFILKRRVLISSPLHVSGGGCSSGLGARQMKADERSVKYYRQSSTHLISSNTLLKHRPQTHSNYAHPAF